MPIQPPAGCRSWSIVRKAYRFGSAATRATIAPVPPTKEERREALKAVYREARGCTRCPGLAAARTTVVFGNGNADADLMFVGEAPGANEDRQGLPFVGQAGKLLDTLLGEVGMAREDVFVANVLKCRPPGNRDPHPAEIEACQDYLLRQVELIEPRVICTLGNFATKLLRGDPTGITRLHGRAEVLTIGRRAVRLYPLFHPAAALYTPSNVEVLRADFARIPELLALDLPPQPVVGEVPAVADGEEAVGSPALSEADAALGAPESVLAEATAGTGEEADGEPEPEGEPGRDAPVAVGAAPEAIQLGLF
jgi:uracil-DNA glycosylase